MTDIITSFLNNLISGAFDGFDAIMLKLLENMLYVEKLLSGALSTNSITNVYNYIYAFACCLVGLKFLTKGFKIYILWRDGDADSSIQDMLTGSAQAAVAMAGFPYLYDLMADVTEKLSNGIMSNFGFSSVTMTDLFKLNATGLGIFELIIIVIYLILVIVLYVMLIKRGVELLILRLGVPFASMGLLDSDYGVFKGYMQTLIKTLLTSIIQITLLSLSIRIMTNLSIVNLICSIAVISTAF
ncbi:MAG: DUF6102 family protein, partial [Oscillospiraceae bacterium]|nr:DUF6102 family protein [Oscillospiraceae bacterium]